MAIFVVKMWLTCDKDDEDVLEAFDTRFPRVLERKWREFTIEAAPAPSPELGNKIDELIFNACQEHLIVDVDPGASQAEIFGGGGGAWTPGSGGQHEGRENVTAEVGGFPQRWSFSVGSETSEIFVHTRHHELK